MLSEKDLIYLGAILIYQSGKAYSKEAPSSEMTIAVNTAKRIYNKVFNENEND